MTRREGSAVGSNAPRATGEGIKGAVLRALLAAGQRRRALDATGSALVQYWHWLRHAAVDERAALLDRVRESVAAGRSGPEAWVAAILGEHDFELVRRATREFLGRRPTSLDRHEAAAAAARDWVRRALALNRAAVFAALAERADEAGLESLRGLRGALTPVEGARVIEACRGPCSVELQEFLDEWRDALA